MTSVKLNSRNRGSGTWLQVAPFALFWGIFVVVPIGLLVMWSYWHEESFWMTPGFTLKAYATFFSGLRLQVLLRTVRVAVTATLIILAVAYPFAYVMERGLSPRGRLVMMILLTAPFFTSLEARTFIWRSILGRTGLINSALIALGLIRAPLDGLLFSEGAVLVGLLSGYFPFMVFPIWMSLSTIDKSLIEASGDLGGSPWHTFRDVVLPLTFPGVMAGCIFVFVSILGETVVPQLLGGGAVTLLGRVIPDTLYTFQYPLASAMSTVLLGLSLGAVWLFNRFLRGERLFSMLSHDKGES